MELIVLNVGLDLGVISPTLFTMLVIMAIVTTMATTPVLRVVMPEAVRRRASISPQPSN
jgi:Kef-type K+ transport system membrane component KefB